MKDKLTIKQAAAISGYSEAHLRRLCIGKAFGDNGAEKFANAWAIDKEALTKFVREAKSRGAPSGPR